MVVFCGERSQRRWLPDPAIRPNSKDIGEKDRHIRVFNHNERGQCKNISTPNDPDNMASSADLQVKSAAHTGFTVASLAAALEFFHGLLGFEILYQREGLEFGEKNSIIGVPGASANIALLSLPGGHQLELLQYTDPAEKNIYQPRPCDVGNAHLALEVCGMRTLIQRAARLDWQPACEEPIEFRRGDGSVWRIAYLKGPDGVTVELMERVGEGE